MLEDILNKEFAYGFWEGFGGTASKLNSGLFYANPPLPDAIPRQQWGRRIGFWSELALVEYGGFFALCYGVSFCTESMAQTAITSSGIYYGMKGVTNTIGYVVHKLSTQQAPEAP